MAFFVSFFQLIMKPFDLELFKSKLTSECKHWFYKYIESTHSTNSDLKILDKHSLDIPFVLIADKQIHGRGQMGRKWQSTPFENIICSIAIHPDRNDGISILSLLLAASICKVLQEIEKSLVLSIKWPNDVLLNGKKVSGILTETNYYGQQLESVIIGFGVNTNQNTFDDDISNIATSIINELSFECERENLLASIMNEFSIWMNLWESNDDAILSFIHARLASYQRQINVLNLDKEIIYSKVYCIGLNQKGYLGITLSDGQIKWIKHEQVRLEVLN